MTEKITVPEQAYRELLCGGDPVEIASRCEIGFPFERRDWMATVGGVKVMIDYLSITTDLRKRLIELSILLTDMIQTDMNAARERIKQCLNDLHDDLHDE